MGYDARFPSMFVLLAHEDREFRRWLGIGLKQKGCQVAAIPNLSSLERIAAELRPDVLLLEPRLLGGLREPVARTASRGARKVVAVVALTYWVGPEQAGMLKGHGASLLAARPEDLDAMVQQLEQMIRAVEAPWEIPGAAPRGVPQAARDPEGLKSVVPAVLPAAPPVEAPTLGTGGLSADWLFEAAPAPDAVVEEAPVDPATVLRCFNEGASGSSVLVVEDDPTFRSFLCMAIAENGFRVFFTSNASNALRALRAQPEIDLIVSDLHMPHMDGFEMKDELDKLSDALIPFIVVTADPTAENRAIALKIGAHALVGKPIIDIETFVRVMKQAICSIPRRKS